MMHLERARELFEAAAALPRDQRTDFVRQHAADDPELMLTVLRLLEHDEPTTSMGHDGAGQDGLPGLAAGEAGSSGQLEPGGGRDHGKPGSRRGAGGPGDRASAGSAAGGAGGGVGLVHGMRLRERQVDWQGGELWLVEPVGGGHKMAALLHPRPDSIRAALVRWRMVRPQVDAVEHPIIGRLIDAGRTGDDRLFLLMQPHLPLTIDDWILHHRPEGASMSAVVTQLAGVLVAAHRKGVYHGRFGAPMVRLRSEQDGPRPSAEPTGSGQAGASPAIPSGGSSSGAPSTPPEAASSGPPNAGAGGAVGAFRVQVNGFGLEQVLGVLAGKGRPLNAAEDWVGLAAVVARLATELEERLPNDPHLDELNRWSEVGRLRAEFDPMAGDVPGRDRAAPRPTLLGTLSTSLLPQAIGGNGRPARVGPPSGYLGLIIGGAVTGILAGEVAIFVARDAGLVWGSAAALTVGVLSAGLALVMGYGRRAE